MFMNLPFAGKPASGLWFQMFVFIFKQVWTDAPQWLISGGPTHQLFLSIVKPPHISTWLLIKPKICESYCYLIIFELKLHSSNITRYASEHNMFSWWNLTSLRIGEQTSAGSFGKNMGKTSCFCSIFCSIIPMRCPFIVGFVDHPHDIFIKHIPI